MSGLGIMDVYRPSAASLADALEVGTSTDLARVKDKVAPGGVLTTSVWLPAPSIFRLRLTGTGTVVLDSRDSLGAITLNVGTFIAAAATDQIEFPFAGTSAVDVRGTFPATMTVEVI